MTSYLELNPPQDQARQLADLAADVYPLIVKSTTAATISTGVGALPFG